MGARAGDVGRGVVHHAAALVGPLALHLTPPHAGGDYAGAGEVEEIGAAVAALARVARVGLRAEGAVEHELADPVVADRLSLPRGEVGVDWSSRLQRKHNRLRRVEASHVEHVAVLVHQLNLGEVGWGWGQAVLVG